MNKWFSILTLMFVCVGCWDNGYIYTIDGNGGMGGDGNMPNNGGMGGDGNMPNTNVGGNGGMGVVSCGYAYDCMAFDDVQHCRRAVCVNRQCTTEPMPNGDSCASWYVCDEGQCITRVPCKTENVCVDGYVNSSGVCVFYTQQTWQRACPFNGHTGICSGGECYCDSNDDCDDGIIATTDECADNVCIHSNL